MNPKRWNVSKTANGRDKRMKSWAYIGLKLYHTFYVEFVGDEFGGHSAPFDFSMSRFSKCCFS